MVSRTESSSTGVFDLVMGLPVHPLIVHLAVVLIPLAAIAAIVMAVKPGVSRKYGAVIIGITVVGQLSSIVAKLSGEALLERLDMELERHTELGNLAPLASVPLLVLVILLYQVDRRRRGSKVRKLIAVLTVVAAVFAAGYIALTGHSGAEAVWSWVQFN
ncbi:MAG: DUF2231 domain-containing protein [Candidatus Nanopelagicales bacterium]